MGDVPLQTLNLKSGGSERGARDYGKARRLRRVPPLDPQPSTLNPQPSTLNPQSSTLNPQLSTLAGQDSSSYKDRQERHDEKKRGTQWGSCRADGCPRRPSTRHPRQKTRQSARHAKPSAQAQRLHGSTRGVPTFCLIRPGTKARFARPLGHNNS